MPVSSVHHPALFLNRPVPRSTAVPMSSSPRGAASLPGLPKRSTRSPYRKRLAVLRFYLSKSPLLLIALITVLLLPLLYVLINLSSSLIATTQVPPLSPLQNLTTHNSAKSFVDPCILATPQPLIHFDPATRYSLDIPKALPPDTDPTVRNRIFTTFFSKYLFELSSDVVTSLNSTSRVHSMDVNAGISTAQVALRHFYKDPSLSVTSYSLGYTHLDRVHGARHIFHLHTRNASHDSLRHVVTIQRTFDARCHLSVRAYPPASLTKPVFLIVPYATRPKRLTWFLNQFESLISNNVPVRLLLAVCKHNAADVAHAREVASSSDAVDYISVVPVPGDRTSFFSRAISIREAARLVPRDSIMFITDIDMYIFPSMFDACRLNAIQGSQVYFPVFYSLYARYSRIGRNAGYWRESSLGMSCMYRSDFDHVAAYKDAEKKFVGWGSEDRVLSLSFLKDKQYEVFRAVEPALRHKWHLKHCEAFTPAYEDCLAVTFQQLGQMASVGRFLLKNKFDVQKFYSKYADDDDDGVEENSGGNSSDKEEAELRNRRKRFLKKNHQLILKKRAMMAKKWKDRHVQMEEKRLRESVKKEEKVDEADGKDGEREEPKEEEASKKDDGTEGEGNRR